MVKRALPVAVALAVLVAGPAAARAPRLVTRPDLAGHVRTDGKRYAVSNLNVGGVRVLDTVTDRERDVPLPPECPSDLPGGLAGPAGGGVALLSCRDGLRVLDLRTLAITPPIGLNRLAPGPCTQARPGALGYGPIGRYWVRVQVYWYRGSATCWVNWRTGHVVTPAQSADAMLDPDRRGLNRRLCAPITRAPEPDDPDAGTGEPFGPISYEPPYAVRPRATTGTPNPLVLLRCGHRRAKALSACILGCAGVGIAGGVVSWANRLDVLAYAPATGRRFRWTASTDPNLQEQGVSVDVQRTRREIFVTVPRPFGRPDAVVKSVRVPARVTGSPTRA